MGYNGRVLEPMIGLNDNGEGTVVRMGDLWRGYRNNSALR